MLKSARIKFCDATQEELRNELIYRVHTLYRDFIWVLRAQGALTPEKLKLIKHVKEYLRISEHKHKADCRIAAIHPELELIARCVAGPYTDVSWYKESTTPSLPTYERSPVDVHSYLYKITDAVSEADRYFANTKEKERTAVVKLETSEFKKFMKDRRKQEAQNGTTIVQPEEPVDKCALHLTIVVQEEKDEETGEEEKDLTVKPSLKRTYNRSTRKTVSAKPTESSKDSTDTDKVLMPPPPPPPPTAKPHSPNVPKVPTVSISSSSSPAPLHTSPSVVNSSSPAQTSPLLRRTIKILPPTSIVKRLPKPAQPPSTAKVTLPPQPASTAKEPQPLQTLKVLLPSQPPSTAKVTLPPQPVSTTKEPPAQPPQTPKVLLPSQAPTTPKVLLPSQPPSTAKVLLPSQPPSTAKVLLPSQPPSTAKVLLPAQPPSTAKVLLPAQPPSTAKVLLPAQPPSTTKVLLTSQPTSTAKAPLPAHPPSTAKVPLLSQPPSTTKVPLPAQPPSTAKVLFPAQPPSTAKVPLLSHPPTIAKVTSSSQTPLVTKVPSSIQTPSITNLPLSAQPLTIANKSSCAQTPSVAKVLLPNQPSSIVKMSSPSPLQAMAKVPPSSQPSAIAKVQSSVHNLPTAKVSLQAQPLSTPKITSSVRPPSITKVPTSQPPSILAQYSPLASLQSSILHSTPPLKSSPSSVPLVTKKVLGSPPLPIPTIDLTDSPESKTTTSSLPSAVSNPSFSSPANVTIPVPNLETATLLTNVTQTVQVSNKPLMSTHEVPSSQLMGLPNTVVQPGPSLSELNDIPVLSLPDSLDTLPPLVIVPPPEPVITVPHSSSFSEPVPASTFILPSGMSFQLKEEGGETLKRKRKLSENSGAVINTETAPKTLAMSQLSKLTPVMVNATTVNSHGQMKISAISRVTSSTQPTLSTSLASSAQKVIIVTNSAARATLNMRPNTPVIQRVGPRPHMVGGSPGVASLRPKLMQGQGKSQPSLPPRQDNVAAVNSAPVQTSAANIVPRPPAPAGNMRLVNPPHNATSQKLGTAPPGYRMVQRGSVTPKSHSAKHNHINKAHNNSESMKKLISNKFVVIQNPKRGAKQPVKPPPPVKEPPRTVVTKKPPPAIATSTGNNVVVLDLSQEELNQNLSATIAEILQASGIITSSSHDSKVTFSHSNNASSSNKLSESDLSFIIQGADTLTSRVCEAPLAETTQDAAKVGVESLSDSAVAVQHSSIDIPTNLCLEEYSSQQDF